jgi:DNA polymerase III epsilon subunit-like protein
VHYIVMDFEWNQPLSRKQSAYLKVGGRLMFEMLQIGAVKLDEKRRLVGSFCRYIAPQHYIKLHPRIRRITGINQDDLTGAPGFREAVDTFLAWCGEDALLMTWGNDDVSVWQQNLNFFAPDIAMPPVYDLQRLFVAQEGGGNLVKRGLAASMARYGILPTNDHLFHNAVDDAYYAALVFQRIPDISNIREYAATPKELGKAKSTESCKQTAYTIRNEAAYLASKRAMEAACPVSGQKITITEGHVPQRSGTTWLALADCPLHGLVLVETSFSTDEKGRRVALRNQTLSNEQNPAYVRTKHLQWAQKVRQLKEKQRI